ncbi:MAG TPA: hypothetical protein PKC69_10690 [Chitinophagaceae bacterium]|nr:hypothetical protein [Chitinophagaceae bacterium]
MKNRRFQKYLLQKRSSANNPIDTAGEVKENADPKIDQDVPGFPHGTASRKHIRPQTNTEKKTAAVHIKDGEKRDN